MFITNDAFRDPFSNMFYGDGDTCWKAVELILHQSWFLVSFAQEGTGSEKGIEFGRNMLMSNFQQVEQLLELKSQDGLRVNSVNIITPSHVNGTDGWRMDKVSAVWLGKTPSMESQLIEVFETSSGQKFSISSLGVPASQMTLERLKVQFH